MKKVINNKNYDTYSSWSIGESVKRKKGTDRYIRDELFIKPTGEFFMLREQNISKKSTQIIPLDDRNARLWMRDHCGAYAAEYIRS